MSETVCEGVRIKVRKVKQECVRRGGGGEKSHACGSNIERRGESAWVTGREV